MGSPRAAAIAANGMAAKSPVDSGRQSMFWINVTRF